MNENIIKLLASYLGDKNYRMYNEILSKEIISIFVKKIQEKNEDFLYSSLVELMEFSEIYLDGYCAKICFQFYNLKNMNYNPEILAEKLMNIYEKITSI